MRRSEVLQRVLGLFPSPTYLEIGVDAGTTFHEVVAPRKVAVDPHFKFDVAAREAAASPAAVSYCNMTSDRYFASENQGRETFDVAFIDGLHTFDQTLRDLLNAMTVLNDGGILVVDDVIPANYISSVPDVDLMFRYQAAIGSNEATWMGDVYRLVIFVRDYFPLFSYATIEENHGQMVMWQQARPAVDNPRSVESVCRAEYLETVLDKDLFNLQPFESIMTSLEARPHRA